LSDRLSEWLDPDHTGRSPREQDQLLARARAESLDLAELVGLAIALTMTVFLTRYSAAEQNWAGQFSAVLINFVVAIPLVLLVGAPFYSRRTRLHLHDVLRDGKNDQGK